MISRLLLHFYLLLATKRGQGALSTLEIIVITIISVSIIVGVIFFLDGRLDSKADALPGLIEGLG